MMGERAAWPQKTPAAKEEIAKRLCLPAVRGHVRFHEIQSDRNNRCVKKIVIETRIYSGSRINLLIMIDRTRDTKSQIGSTSLD
jgi:hypothetical protein